MVFKRVKNRYEFKRKLSDIAPALLECKGSLTDSYYHEDSLWGNVLGRCGYTNTANARKALYMTWRKNWGGIKEKYQECLISRDIHKKLSWMFGNWKAEGSGSYPTIKSFKYYEEIEFCDNGFPFVCYKAKSWTAERDKPMHWESGFLRFNNDRKTASLVIAHNFGVAEVMEGQVTSDKKELQLTSNKDTMSRTSDSKSPAVVEEKRIYKLVGSNKMEMKLFMANEEQPLQLHLCITYDRVQ